MIETIQLWKSFGQLEVLKGIDIQIPPGILAILGPNGSGKSTFVKSILGHVIPDKGKILINGKDVVHGWQHRRQVRYLPQTPRFPDNITVKELMRMIQDLRDESGKAEPLIQLFQLGPHMDKKLGTLSGGTRQKVNLVLAFMFDSDILILDEPTSGLDPISQLRLKELIIDEKFKGRTIILTTHILSLVEELADRIAFLLDGKLYFSGTLKEVREKAQRDDLEHAIAQLLSTKP